MQEKTLLDFWPRDDKYREVLMEANLVLQELEAQEDWTWLRETLILGDCKSEPGEIVSFTLPDTVYKLSMWQHDCVRLYPVKIEDTINNEIILNEAPFIPVPIVSAGNQRYTRQVQVNHIGVNHVHDPELKAVVHGNVIKFSRPLTPPESNLVAVVDVQKHITPFHVCNTNGVTCTTTTSTCPNAAAKYLTEVPDPNYVVIATAARHAEGSPPALARVAGLQDQAQRILSQMRQNDSAATDSDYIDWDVPGYIEVI
jgi:hypothetical protein